MARRTRTRALGRAPWLRQQVEVEDDGGQVGWAGALWHLSPVCTVEVFLFFSFFFFCFIFHSVLYLFEALNDFCLM